MLSILTTAAGLAIGALTGFFFERRATRAAEEQIRVLREELRDLQEKAVHDVQESFYSVGGTSQHHSLAAADSELHHVILKWAERVQDASGRVSRSQLVSEFVREGHSREQVELALGTLESTGLVRADGAWLELS